MECLNVELTMPERSSVENGPGINMDCGRSSPPRPLTAVEQNSNERHLKSLATATPPFPTLRPFLTSVVNQTEACLLRALINLNSRTHI